MKYRNDPDFSDRYPQDITEDPDHMVPLGAVRSRFHCLQFIMYFNEAFHCAEMSLFEF